MDPFNEPFNIAKLDFQSRNTRMIILITYHPVGWVTCYPPFLCLLVGNKLLTLRDYQ